MRAAALAIVLSMAAAPAAAQQFPCSNAAVAPYPALVATGHDHGRVAPAPPAITKPFTAFLSSFDDADDDDGDGVPDFRLNPEFVAYELRGVAPDANRDYPEPDVSIRRPNRWYASPELVPLVDAIEGVENRRIDDSYSGIGTIWNRGHFAMSDHAQRIGPEAACNTHNFWNASPQAADLNQGPWLHLENYTAAAANKYRSIWVVTGPIFDPATPRLTIGEPGELQVEIPDAFFKVVIHESPSGIDTLAFVFEQPNVLDGGGTPVPAAAWIACSRAPGLSHTYDHRPQLTAIAEIERRTGLTFFPGRPDRQALVESRAGALWPVEQQYWDPGPSVCARQRGHP
jgi:DNA/RNA endonuclease G (NUC1)